MYYTIQNNLLIKGEKEALEQFYSDIKEFPIYYEENKYIVEDGELVLNPNYEEEQEQKERERIAKLSLTKREVFLGLFQAKGVTPDQIKAQITDPMALIEFEYANDYYRFNPLIDVVGNGLGITSEQLDKFFDTKDYTYLLPIEEPTEPTEEEIEVKENE
ncbi:MAG: hypothetical protein IKU37_09025 [Candidatus Gastranaerophilales bacterium]|nr:hypothetical protein [Candidatus Gastranaerophilales bacterium]